MKVRSPAKTFSLMRVSWSHLVLCLRVCWLFMAEKRNGCVDVLVLFLCALFPISQLYLAPTFLQPIKNIKELPLLRSCVHILQTIQFNQKFERQSFYQCLQKPEIGNIQYCQQRSGNGCFYGLSVPVFFKTKLYNTTNKANLGLTECVQEGQ